VVNLTYPEKPELTGQDLLYTPCNRKIRKIKPHLDKEHAIAALYRLMSERFVTLFLLARAPYTYTRAMGRSSPMGNRAPPPFGRG